MSNTTQQASSAEQPTAARPWQPVVLVPRGPAGGTYQYVVHAANGGHRVGEVWRSPNGTWRAHRTGYGATLERFPARDQALAAVNWLETVRAEKLTIPAGERGALPGGAYGLNIVLPDGRPAEVLSITEVPDRQHPIEVTAAPLGVRIDLDGAPPADDDADEAEEPTVQVRFRRTDPITLAPPCGECNTNAGQACHYGCQSLLA